MKGDRQARLTYVGDGKSLVLNYVVVQNLEDDSPAVSEISVIK